MRVRYGDEVLRRLAVDAACPPNSWAPGVIRSYRRRHQSLVVATDREDLRHLRCLDLRTENGHNGTRSSIQLADGARLLLDFEPLKTEQVTVVGIIESETREVAP